MDQTLNLALHPYTFISDMKEKKNKDVFETRINFQKTICMTGEEAAKIFYDKNLFTRVKAAPVNLRATLFGKGAIQTLDNEAHLARKQLFMSLVTPEAVESLVAAVREQWLAVLPAWQAKRRIVLQDALSEIICKGACKWAGVPLDSVKRRSAEYNAMIGGGGGGLLRFLKGKTGRSSAEAWIADHVAKVREGSIFVPKNTAAYVIAHYFDNDGRPLSDQVAAVELINLIRPTIAVARYIVYVAMALAEFPMKKPTTEEEKNAFVLEVKRYYPFFPLVAARVQKEFTWNGFTFKAGRRTLFDLYGTNHDRRSWQHPDRFEPNRFLKGPISPFAFVPQGGSEPMTNRRCPGESIATSLMIMALDMLMNTIRYNIPSQDLTVQTVPAPAGPKSGFVIESVHWNQTSVQS